MCSADIFLGLLAVLFPPLPVWVKCGICSADSVINILLCCLGYVPGLLHAWYIIAKFPEPSYYDYERVDESERGGRVAYVVVRDGEQRRTPRPSGRSQPQPQPQPKPQPPPRQENMSYGTNAAESAPQAEAGPSEGAPPPTYAQAVSGDHKIQDQS